MSIFLLHWLDIFACGKETSISVKLHGPMSLYIMHVTYKLDEKKTWLGYFLSLYSDFYMGGTAGLNETDEIAFLN